MFKKLFRIYIENKHKLKPENVAYIISVFFDAFKLKVIRQKDRFFDTRIQISSNARLNPIGFDFSKLDLSQIEGEKLKYLANEYLSHRFDLLGSGWADVSYNCKVKGFEEFAYNMKQINTDKAGEFLYEVLHWPNVKGSKKLWNQLSDDYKPIDWQRDFISGYRWSSDMWYRPQVVADKPGGDIKVPWELGRLQHLPRLAIISGRFEDLSEKMKIDFCNEILDFSATNPPRWGVNYVCTMDIGIRTANVALAYSLFKSQGVRFSDSFESVMVQFMMDHCNHIYNNLEYSKFLTSNHYFADIAGLLWGSAVLPDGAKRTKLLTFAAQEINNEIIKQFNSEGSNSEGSTAYHRLTAEMAVYSLALIKYLRNKGEDLPLNEKACSIIMSSGEFTADISRPDGLFSQIGDNDSGLFFKLSVTGEIVTTEQAKKKYENLSNYSHKKDDEAYLDESLNDSGPFVSAVYGASNNSKLKDYSEKYPLEASLIKQLVNDVFKLKENDSNEPEDVTCDFSKLNHVQEQLVTSDGLDLTQNLKHHFYEQFGLYILKGDNLYLCINATDNGQKGNAGHAHNDKLSFDLFIGGECIFEDCGTYVYTAMPDFRNEFRSVKHHNTIIVDGEQNVFKGLFSMHDETKCEMVSFDERSIVLQVKYRDVTHVRSFDIKPDCVIIKDSCNKDFVCNWEQKQSTRGYGKLLRI